ncbi:MAG: tRNA (adenosine(37)-N6)-threonylcarbamoyltransferase complex dimerization subunit type 1 TsaB [Planctomycetota bacterium]
MLALALDASTRTTHLALRRDNHLLATHELRPQQRHELNLLPALADLFTQHQLTPRDLTHLAIVTGPGSFTGLRAACAAAQMLALTQPHLALHPIPTLTALARSPRISSVGTPTAILLARKRNTAYAALTHHGQLLTEPAVHLIQDFLQDCLHRRPDFSRDAPPAPPPPPLHVLADTDLQLNLPNITQLPTHDVAPDPTAVLDLIPETPPIPAHQLQPLYPRQPEALTLWQQRNQPS